MHRPYTSWNRRHVTSAVSSWKHTSFKEDRLRSRNSRAFCRPKRHTDYKRYRDIRRETVQVEPTNIQNGKIKDALAEICSLSNGSYYSSESFVLEPMPDTSDETHPRVASGMAGNSVEPTISRYGSVYVKGASKHFKKEEFGTLHRGAVNHYTRARGYASQLCQYESHLQREVRQRATFFSASPMDNER